MSLVRDWMEGRQGWVQNEFEDVIVFRCELTDNRCEHEVGGSVSGLVIDDLVCFIV